jgi:trehalose 6-phosphate synthase/phosphatase
MNTGQSVRGADNLKKMSKRLFIISNRLPLTVEQNPNGYQLRPSSGGLISAINSYLNSGGRSSFSEQVWAGFPDCEKAAWTEAINGTLPQSDYEFLPVFVPQRAYQSYYNGFANSLLWPLFHYFPSFAEYNDNDFETYMQVNNLFAETVAKQLRNDDIVWIHDYHLLPLAWMLRKRFPSLSIGFFLHIPFPSYELFRIIPKYWQQEMLKGMAGADLVGFHTLDYADHFLACMEQVLNIEHDGPFFLFEHRKVKADAFPVSIDFDLFQQAGQRREVAALKETYLEIKKDKKLIFSVDRMDYTKGLYNRLRGYHQFLLNNQAYIGRVVFVLVVIPSRDEIDKYAEMKKAIDEYIGNLNSSLGDIGWQPVLYHYNHISFDELIALYTSCDLALITPLRDGMNLVAKEFAASRQDQQGVLVLSEMAGAARELADAVLINPNDITEIADAIKTGLEMPTEEQTRRMSAMQYCISKYNVNVWAKDYFDNLVAVKGQQLDLAVKYLDGFARAKLLTNYAEAGKRLLLLDYDGTLMPFAKDPTAVKPAAIVLQLLHDISAIPTNEVYIISGRNRHILEEWLGHLPIGLIAEHGALTKHKGGSWESSADSLTEEWKYKIAALMDAATLKCPGAFREDKEYSLAWHYRKAAIADGYSRAKKLHEELTKVTALLHLEVIAGNKVIEVRQKGINKGSAASSLTSAGDFDFILCIGDDKTDEDMFVQLAGLTEAFTIKVGMEPSFAKYNLQTTYLVQSLLQSMMDYPVLTK